MPGHDPKVTHDFPGFFRVHRDGTIERYWNADFVPPGINPETGLLTKDIVISSDTNIKARVFLPKAPNCYKKLPILVHYHGGGFCIGSPFAAVFTAFVSSLTGMASVIAISIDYRLAPEHPLPAAYDDSWTALQWVAKHFNGEGPDAWINEYADLDRVILAGESAGANLAHYVAVRAGANGLAGLKIRKLLIVHPYFGGKKRDEMYEYMCPTSSGSDDDPKLNPGADPDLMMLRCEQVLVCVAERDMLRSRGVAYYETMSKRWGGEVEFYETLGEDHCFHLFNPKNKKVATFMKNLVDFIIQEGTTRERNQVIKKRKRQVRLQQSFRSTITQELCEMKVFPVISEVSVLVSNTQNFDILFYFSGYYSNKHEIYARAESFGIKFLTSQ